MHRAPVATAASVLVLALGIAATSSIWSIFDTLLLRALPLPGVERIVQVLLVRPSGPSAQVAEPHYVFWRDHNTVFDSMSAYRGERYNLSDAATPRSVDGGRVTPDYFATLGVELARGPGFSRARVRDRNEVVLSDGLWRDAFAADADIIGRAITLDSIRFTVVGIAPAIPPPLAGELWTPLEIDTASRELAAILRVVARLKPGIGRAEAQAEMEVVQRRLLELAGATSIGAGVSLRPIQDFLYGSRRATLLLLLVAAGFVLALGSANVANIQLSRLVRRHREIAIRRALGASVSRTLAPLMAETLLLTAAGAVAGIALAFLLLRWLRWSEPTILVDAPPIGIDLRVVTFAVAVSLAAALLGCAAPAFEAARVDPSRSLGARSPAAAGGWLRWSRPTLVVAEVSVTLWALLTAILLGESYKHVVAVDPGVDTAGVLTVELPLSRNAEGEPLSLPALDAVLLPRLRGLPGVAAVSASSSIPLESGAFLTYAIDGAAADADPALAQFRGVSPEFFATFGVEVVAGRPFTAADGAGTAPVAIVSERGARRHWPGRSPLGERLFVFPGSRYGEPLPRTVVGVVADVLELGLVQAESWESLYVPLTQIAPPLAGPIFNGGVLLALRSEIDARELGETVRREIRDYDKSQPIGAVRSMDHVVRRSAAPHEFRSTAVSGFAATTLLLAAIGIYGVFSVLAQARRRELAIRLTLGSTMAGLVRLILRQGAAPVALGLVLGWFGALLSARFVGAFLFGVRATSAAALGVAVLVLVAAAGLAMLPPALKTAKLDPMPFLRQE